MLSGYLDQILILVKTHQTRQRFIIPYFFLMFQSSSRVFKPNGTWMGKRNKENHL